MDYSLLLGVESIHDVPKINILSDIDASPVDDICKIEENFSSEVKAAKTSAREYV